MSDIDTRLNKARSEVNLAENTLGRALYALDQAIKARAEEQPCATPDTVSSPLPPLDIRGMRLWKWSTWHASEWDNGFSNIPWRASRVHWQSDDTVLLDLTDAGAPELQAPDSALRAAGLWQIDVTLPEKREGLCVAPLWLYAKSDGQKGEIDFEFTRKGLQVTIHSHHTGAAKSQAVVLPNSADWGGKRFLLGIRADIDAGVIEMLVDGKVVHTFRRDDHPEAFPTEPLKAFISMWTARVGLGWAEGWLGKWGGLTSTERLAMLVHGYSLS